MQLIDVICDNLPAHFREQLCNDKLIITGANAIPDEITVGGHIKRHDMANGRVVTDVIIVNQVMSGLQNHSLQRQLNLRWRERKGSKCTPELSCAIVRLYRDHSKWSYRIHFSLPCKLLQRNHVSDAIQT